MKRTDILESLKNNVERPYKILHFVPEVTFEGTNKQPDFGEVTILYIPRNKLIELKSLKKYFYQFRNMLFSYETLVNTVYDDINTIYKPRYLKVTLETNPRGGISSFLEVETE